MLLTILSAVMIVSLISFVGAITLCWKSEKLKHFLDVFVSFAAGAMIAAALLDLLPEAAEELGLKVVAPYVLVGIVVFFLWLNAFFIGITVIVMNAKIIMDQNEKQLRT